MIDWDTIEVFDRVGRLMAKCAAESSNEDKSRKRRASLAAGAAGLGLGGGAGYLARGVLDKRKRDKKWYRRAWKSVRPGPHHFNPTVFI